jgi:hypothetical protein
MLAEILHKIKELDQQENYKYSPRPSLSGPQRCIRSLDYYAQGFPPSPFPGRAMQVMDDSSWHEQLILEEIRKSAYGLHSEQMHINIPIGLPLRERKCLVKINGQECGKTIPTGCAAGHIDGIITDMLGIDRILEIKAISHFGFQAIWNGEIPWDYIFQTTHYMEGILEINPEIKEGLLFFKNKNQAQYLDILLRYDNEKDELTIGKMTLSTGESKDINSTLPGALTQSRTKFQEVERYKIDKKLHPRQYTFDNWHCEYCRWGATCWEGWEQEIQAVPDTLEFPEPELDEAYERDCINIININAVIKQHEGQKDIIEDRLKTAIRDKARHGKAGSYIWGLRPQFKSSLNKDKIAPEVVAAATEKKLILVFEAPKTLKIKEPRGKKDKKNE